MTIIKCDKYDFSNYEFSSKIDFLNDNEDLIILKSEDDLKEFYDSEKNIYGFYIDSKLMSVVIEFDWECSSGDIIAKNIISKNIKYFSTPRNKGDVYCNNLVCNIFMSNGSLYVKNNVYGKYVSAGNWNKGVAYIEGNVVVSQGFYIWGVAIVLGFMKSKGSVVSGNSSCLYAKSIEATKKVEVFGILCTKESIISKKISDSANINDSGYVFGQRIACGGSIFADGYIFAQGGDIEYCGKLYSGCNDISCYGNGKVKKVTSISSTIEDFKDFSKDKKERLDGLFLLFDNNNLK